MKFLFLVFVFILLTVSAKSQTLKGSVKLFPGYYALQTEDGERIILPKWINTKLLSQDKNHEILIEGSVRNITCPRQPESCATSEMTKVRWVQYQNNSITSRNILYTGSIKRFKGRAVESNYTYDYIALEANQQKISIPVFFDTQKLLQFQPQVTLMGEAREVICIDMSDACGPSKLESVTMFKLQF